MALSASRRRLLALLLCALLGIAGLLLAVFRGGLLPWLFAAFLLLGVRIYRRPGSGDLGLVLRMLAGVVGLTVVAGVGMVALWESEEVIVLRQQDADGGHFSTRLWIVDLDGVPSFFGRPPEEHRRMALLRDHPTVELVRHGHAECRRAVLATPSETVRTAAERLYLEKYGARVYFAGRLVALLLGGPDRDEAPDILVRLEPCPAPR